MEILRRPRDRRETLNPELETGLGFRIRDDPKPDGADQHQSAARSQTAKLPSHTYCFRPAPRECEHDRVAFSTSQTFRPSSQQKGLSSRKKPLVQLLPNMLKACSAQLAAQRGVAMPVCARGPLGAQHTLQVTGLAAGKVAHGHLMNTGDPAKRLEGSQSKLVHSAMAP